METVSRRCRAVALAVALLLAIAGGAVATAVTDGLPYQTAPIGHARPAGTPLTGAAPALDHVRAELLARWRRLLAPFLASGPANSCPTAPADLPGDLPC